MKIESAYFSRKGQKEKNEDSVMPPLNSNGNWWSAIADGMGGRAGGSVASAAVIDTVKSSIETQHEADISKIFFSAHNRLQTIAKEQPGLDLMGTTLSLIRLSKDTASVGHVGDSRIYHLRSNGIVNRTVDQTEVEQLVQQGVLSKARARRYPRRNILLSVLSATRDYDLHQETFKIREGDRLILLTDGVSSKVLRQEIRNLSLQRPSPQDFCNALAEEVEKRSPQDDYSAICLDVKS